MEIWHYWIIAGIGLLIGEIFTPGFVLGMMGLACFCGAAADVWGYGATGQVLSFAAGLLVGFVFIRPLFLKYLYSKDKKSLTNREAMLGQIGLVVEPLDPKTRAARVKVGGSEWKAVAAGEQNLARDVRVRILDVDGATLKVEPLDERE